jgi:hypothetical protein
MDEVKSRHSELKSQWLTTDYQLGDALFFQALMIHKALPNTTDDQMRISLDNRYHPIGNRIAEHMLTPHLDEQHPLEWDEIYRNWETDDLKYYWKKINNPISKKYTGFHDKAFWEALKLARNGDSHGILHMRRMAVLDKDGKFGNAAKEVLQEIGQ